LRSSFRTSLTSTSFSPTSRCILRRATFNRARPTSRPRVSHNSFDRTPTAEKPMSSVSPWVAT
jgi:hypothetical protein